VQLSNQKVRSISVLINKFQCGLSFFVCLPGDIELEIEEKLHSCIRHVQSNHHGCDHAHAHTARTRKCTREHARTRTCMRAHTCARAHTHARARTHTHIHTHQYVTHSHMHACTHMCARTHTCARAHTHARARAHTHTHTHTNMSSSSLFSSRVCKSPIMAHCLLEQ